mmetsp:Transcript_91995/g.210677  ORF Transcript_91995/g.210677 Transcript_91995/m.210677 type:complete len:272 (+) Transcript_91995:85-900(+)
MDKVDEPGWLPQQHEDQLRLGCKIVENAFNSKVQALSNDVRVLRESNEEKKQVITQQQGKITKLETELIDNHQQMHQLKSENKELLNTVRELRKHIERLEGLKKAVMSSLQAESEHMLGHNEQPYALMSEESLRSAAPLTVGEVEGRGHMPARSQASPGAGASQSADHLGLGNTYGSVTSPLPSYGGDSRVGGLDGGGGPSSPPAVDGKQFFRVARNNLSYENFNAFLGSIKRLNNHQQSREQTLEEAKQIFGSEHENLYRDFQTLLNRHN